MAIAAWLPISCASMDSFSVQPAVVCPYNLVLVNAGDGSPEVLAPHLAVLRYGTLPEAVFNTEGVLLEANSSYCELLGRESWQLAGVRYDALGAEGDRTSREEVFHRALVGMAQTCERRYLRDDGSSVIAIEGLSPMSDDCGDFVLAQLVDISERAFEAEALQFVNAELEQQLLQRDAQLTASTRELESFCYSVSHDLRGPIRSIDGFSLALLEDCGERLGSMGRDYMMRVRAACQRMGELIDGLLSLSRFTRAQIKLELLDLSAMAASVLNELADREPSRQLACSVQKGLTAMADAKLTRALLEHLLENAWKFTASTPNASVRFEYVADAPSRQYFRVSDNGSGFDPSHSAKLFQPFERLHSGHEAAGNGLGLAIAQRIVQRHGGSIWADSTPGEGASFMFTLEPERCKSPT